MLRPGKNSGTRQTTSLVNEAFEREIELVASLHRPNIVIPFDSGIAHGKYWYAMDYLRGRQAGVNRGRHRRTVISQFEPAADNTPVIELDDESVAVVMPCLFRGRYCP